MRGEAYHFSQIEQIENGNSPSCSHECIWYEPSEDDQSCLNRHEMICSLHREEIFHIKE